MQYVVRPISDRTTFTGKPRSSPFDAPWSRTIALLGAEVRHLRGRDVVMELDVTERDLRLDGMVRANARPASPAVRIAFESADHGPLTYATDRFTAWQDNVRAIALGLEALRKVDRYGITKRGEQYRGFRAIGAGSGAGSSHMTADDAADVLVQYGAGEVDPERAWRKARAATHPDRHGGDQALWDRVEQAARVLGLNR